MGAYSERALTKARAPSAAATGKREAGKPLAPDASAEATSPLGIASSWSRISPLCDRINLSGWRSWVYGRNGTR